MQNDGKHSEPSRSSDGSDQRRKLEESERKAAKEQPENYQEADRDAKVVSTGQDNANDVGSIQGIDNDDAREKDSK